MKLGIHVHHAFPYISLPTTSRNCLISRFVEKENIIITANIKYLIHVTREFYFAKVICRNLYALFSNVRRAYTVNKNGVQLFITGGRITNLILLHEKFLQFDWLRAVVFQLNLKYLRVKITNLLRVVV